MNSVFPSKPISSVTKVITSPVDKKTILGEIPVFLCNYTDVYYNSIITGNMQFMEATANQSEIDRFSLCPNDVVITKDSESADDIGIPTYIESIKENLLCGYHLTILRPKKYIDGRFLSFSLIHPRISYDFYRYANGITRFGLTAETYSKIKIPLPPLPEQKAIADLLSTWDEAIEKTERLVKAKEKQFRQLSRCLLFGHKRLRKQKNELVDGQFFEYPSDWALVKIGKVAKEISARNGETEVTVLSCSKYDGFVNSLDYFGKQVFSSDTSNYKVIKKGQFGYPSNHVEEGSIGFLEHCEKGIVSPIYIVFEAAKDKVHSPYLYKLLKTDIYRHIFQVSTSSSVDRRGSLRWSDFSKIKVLVPSIEEQQKISKTLFSAQHELNLLKQLADKYKTQKRGLMQKMLTGEWRAKPEIINQFLEVKL